MSSLQSELLDRAQQLHYKVEADEEQLCEVTNQLAQATQLSVASNNKRILIKQQATSAHERVKMLLVEKSEVERQLKFRQGELGFLQQLQGYLVGSDDGRWDRKGEELMEVLIQKDKEVKQLQEQLSEVEKKLHGVCKGGGLRFEGGTTKGDGGTGREVSQSTGTGEDKG